MRRAWGFCHLFSFEYYIAVILLPFLIWILYCCVFTTFSHLNTILRWFYYLFFSKLYCCDFATFSHLNTILLWFCYLFLFEYYIFIYNMILIWFCYDLILAQAVTLVPLKWGTVDVHGTIQVPCVSKQPGKGDWGPLKTTRWGKAEEAPRVTTYVPAFRCKARTAYKSELHTHVIYIFNKSELHTHVLYIFSIWL